MFNKLNQTYHKFPSKFWVLIMAMFIDMIGGTLLHPFIALYITDRFNVGMTTAGIILGIFALSGLAGNIFGGALTDKFGRRNIILFGLIFSALSTLTLGFVSQLSMLFPLAVVIGFIGSVAFPAHQAMVADMLPEEKRADGFGLLRVVANLSWIIGPTIGGFVASRSFFSLFVFDAIISLIVAGIFFKLIPETMPAKIATAPKESLGRTLRGYGKILKDRPFTGYLLVTILALIVYQQMYNTLSVYMRDMHGFPTQWYGILLSTSAITVVLFQLWVTGKTKTRPPFLMMALGTVFYMVGFSMFGIFDPYAYFVIAIIVVTVGEMIAVPVAQTLTAKFAPEEMRGRYMAAFSLAWSLPQAVGPGLAGAIMDNSNPDLIWLGGGVILAVASIGYFLLHLRLRTQVRFRGVAVEEDSLPPVENPLAG
jgi:MFS family permease